MSTTQAQVIDVTKGHEDYLVDTRLFGQPLIGWHGQQVDLRQLTVSQADGLAKDPHQRWFQFSAARKAKDMQAAMADATKTVPPAEKGKKK